MFLNDFCFKEGNKSCKIYYSLCHYRFWLIIRDITDLIVMYYKVLNFNVKTILNLETANNNHSK